MLNVARSRRQMLAAWAPSTAPPRSFFGRLRAVQPAGYANAIVGLYVGTALLGAVVYLYFKVDNEFILTLFNENYLNRLTFPLGDGTPTQRTPL